MFPQCFLEQGAGEEHSSSPPFRSSVSSPFPSQSFSLFPFPSVDHSCPTCQSSLFSFFSRLENPQILSQKHTTTKTIAILFFPTFQLDDLFGPALVPSSQQTPSHSDPKKKKKKTTKKTISLTSLSRGSPSQDASQSAPVRHIKVQTTEQICESATFSIIDHISQSFTDPEYLQVKIHYSSEVFPTRCAQTFLRLVEEWMGLFTSHIDLFPFDVSSAPSHPIFIYQPYVPGYPLPEPLESRLESFVIGLVPEPKKTSPRTREDLLLLAPSGNEDLLPFGDNVPKSKRVQVLPETEASQDPQAALERRKPVEEINVSRFFSDDLKEFELIAKPPSPKRVVRFDMDSQIQGGWSNTLPDSLSSPLHIQKRSDATLKMKQTDLLKFSEWTLAKDSSLPSTLEVHCQFNAREHQLDLSEGSQTILTEAGAGCNHFAQLSEAFAFEVLGRLFGARLSLSEMQIFYRPSGVGSTAPKIDFLVDFEKVPAAFPSLSSPSDHQQDAEGQKKRVAVSVTRMYCKKPVELDSFCHKLILKKLNGLKKSLQFVSADHQWQSQILFVWSPGPSVTSSVLKAIPLISAERPDLLSPSTLLVLCTSDFLDQPLEHAFLYRCLSKF